MSRDNKLSPRYVSLAHAFRPRTKRVFVEQLRALGRSIRVSDLPCGAGAPHRTCAEVFYGRYAVGALHLNGQRIQLTYRRLPSPLRGKSHLFICPGCDRQCLELFCLHEGGPWKCRCCYCLVYASTYQNHYVKKGDRNA